MVRSSTSSGTLWIRGSGPPAESSPSRPTACPETLMDTPAPPPRPTTRSSSTCVPSPGKETTRSATASTSNSRQARTAVTVVGCVAVADNFVGNEDSEDEQDIPTTTTSSIQIEFGKLTITGNANTGENNIVGWNAWSLSMIVGRIVTSVERQDV